jgi:opacity protein-like surface antigen
MKLRSFALTLAALAVAGGTTLRAQSILPFSVEARAGAALPTGEFKDGAGTAWGVGGTVRYHAMPMLGIYAGYDQFTFSVDEGDAEFGDSDANFRDAAFRLGARFQVPFAGLTGVSPWVEGGAVLARTSLNASDQGVSLSFDSDRSLGFEAGAGLNFAVAPKVSLTPGVRFRSHEATFDFDGDEETGTVSFVAIDLGVNIKL